MKYFAPLIVAFAAVGQLVAASPAAKPPADTYYIINRVFSPEGHILTMTFNGQGQYATVTPLGSTDESRQRWVIKDYDAKTQSISPLGDQKLQAAWGDEGVKILPAGSYVWTINNGDEGYTIQDGGETAYWGLDHAVVGSNIAISSGSGDEKKRWILVKTTEDVRNKFAL